jgi:hypothetical protein
MYDYASIVPLVSLALLPLSALYVVVNTLILKRRMGPLVESFCPRFHFQFLGVLLFSPALIALAWYREFTSLPLFALCGVGVIGFYIAVRDLFVSRFTGAYRDGVLWSNAMVRYDDIDSLVLLDSCTLVFVLRNGHEKIFAAEDEEAVSRLEQQVKSAVPTLQ